MIDFSKYIDYSRLESYETFLIEMNKRGLASWYKTQYVTNDPQMETSVMYFQPLTIASDGRRMFAKDIIGVPNSVLSLENKVINAALPYLYGPNHIGTCLTGITSPEKAHVDFDRVHVDSEYVEEIRQNVAFARQYKIPIWTNTELHTSLQTEARNYCRIKYNDPRRKADSVDMIEWLAYLKTTGWCDKILSAKTLEDAYEAFIIPRGIGPFYGGNCVSMIANLKEVSYDHMNPFCALGVGSIVTINWLFEKAKLTGSKFKPLEAVQWIFYHQEKIFTRYNVPVEFQNMNGWIGKVLKEDQTRLTCNSLEVSLCQYSIYRKFKEFPEMMGRRPNIDYDLSPFDRRKKSLIEF